MRILQWNVLNRPFDASKWNSEKWPALQSTILSHEPQIVTLQEVPFFLAKDLDSKLGEIGWDSVCCSPVQDREDVCVVAWDTSRLIQADEDGLHVTYEDKDIDAVTALLNPIDWTDPETGDLKLLTVTSYHGYWGALRQSARMGELVKMNREINELEADASLMCGDFNAPRDEDSIRWLMGEYMGLRQNEAGRIVTETTFWNEAQEVAVALGKKDKPEPTSLATGVAVETAAPHGINIEHMPARRIEFLASKGWSYGKRGGWTGDVLVEAHDDLSDHALLVADVID